MILMGNRNLSLLTDYTQTRRVSLCMLPKKPKSGETDTNPDTLTAGKDAQVRVTMPSFASRLSIPASQDTVSV